MDDFERRIGHLIRTARISKGMNQSELARMLGLSFQQLQKYEVGRNRITCGRLWRISQALGVPVSYFFEDLAADQEGHDTLSALEETPPPKKVVNLARKLWEIEDPRIRRQMIMLIEALHENPVSTEEKTEIDLLGPGVAQASS